MDSIGSIGQFWTSQLWTQVPDHLRKHLKKNVCIDCIDEPMFRSMKLFLGILAMLGGLGGIVQCRYVVYSIQISNISLPI